MKQSFLTGRGFFKNRNDPVLKGTQRLPFRYDALGYAFIPAFMLFLVALLAISFDLWGFFNVPVVENFLFLDLQQITYTAECYREGVWRIQDGTTCDPLFRPYNYPTIWVFLLGGVLGLGSQQTFYLGAMLLVFTVWAIGILTYITVAGGTVRGLGDPSKLKYVSLSRRHNFFIVGLMTVAAISPPVMFAIERGNIDQFVFFLSVLSILVFLTARGTFGRILAGLLFSFVAWLKLFPLLGILVVFANSWRRRIMLLSWLIGLSIAGVFLFREMSYIVEGTPQGSAVSFGSTVLFKVLVYPDFVVPGYSETQLRLAGLLIVAVFAAVLYLVLNKTGFRIVWLSFLNDLLKDTFSKSLILAGGGIFVAAFLLGASVDYRLIFVLPLIAGFARLASRHNPFPAMIAVFLVVQLWSTKFEGDPRAPLNIVSDFFWVVFVAFLIVVIIFIIKKEIVEAKTTNPIVVSSSKKEKLSSEKVAVDSSVKKSAAAEEENRKLEETPITSQADEEEKRTDGGL